MTSKIFSAVLSAAALTVAVSPAMAQTPAAASAAPAITHGPAINGMCVVSVENAIGASTVGKFVTTRLQQLVAQVNAELNAEKTSLDNDAKALDAQRATLDQTTLEQRYAALQVRGSALQRKAQLRDREVQATEQKALNRVGTEMEPMIRQAYQAKGCSILINRNSVVLANPATDITPQVITALNGKLTQFTFDRERLDQNASAAGGGAPAPIQTPGAKPR